MKKLKFYSLILTLFLCSCGSVKDISYFQDIYQGTFAADTVKAADIRIRPDDKISIMVNSRDPQLSDLFNLPVVSRQVGMASRTTGPSNNTQGISGYTVGKDGNIDFPIVGEIHVAGMTRNQIAKYIKEQLVSRNLVKDPVVTVEFMNLCVSVLGEVNRPGQFYIDRDKCTLLDALSMAGDLTIYGKRGNVVVLRRHGNEQQAYQANLCSAKDLVHSPVFYLQQNDVVYVEPNTTKARQSTVNGNNVRSTSFWISLASLLTTIAVLVFK